MRRADQAGSRLWKGRCRVRIRGLLIVIVALGLAAAAVLGYLGLNPPEPVSKPVQKVLPNDKFQAR